MTTRRASHANSWYTGSKTTLSKELDDWLSQAGNTTLLNSKAIIAPHAGYSYSGATAAWAYKSIDTANIQRVFILGPSHHVYLNGCALTKCTEYATPLGNLSIDSETVAELRNTGEFSDMTQAVDEAEHSIEMHLPYIHKIFSSSIKIVPILIGSISSSTEAHFGNILAPYLAHPQTFFIVSTDFCHWGSRFSYTHYLPSASLPGFSLSRANQSEVIQPIFKSIEALDRAGMSSIAFSSPNRKPSLAQQDFCAYLKETKNTICGRHPIGVLLGALASLETKVEWEKMKLEWLEYQQSGEVEGIKDSSVSYASGVVLKCL